MKPAARIEKNVSQSNVSIDDEQCSVIVLGMRLPRNSAKLSPLFNSGCQKSVRTVGCNPLVYLRGNENSAPHDTNSNGDEMKMKNYEKKTNAWRLRCRPTLTNYCTAIQIL